MPTVAFRPLRAADLPLLRRWHNQPHVKRWYDADKDLTTLEAAASHYRDLLDGTDPTRAFTILVDGEPAGYIQTYMIADNPDYAAALDLGAERAAGLDLFLGEPHLVHRGLGPRVIHDFLEQVVFADPHVDSCVIGPEPANAVAIRAYEKAGFRYLKTVQVPGEPAPEVILRRARREAQ